MNNLHLLSYMPDYYKTSNSTKNILSSTENQLKNISSNIDTKLNDLFITTSNDLSRLENILGIKQNLNKSIEERRKRILAKLRSTGTTTKEAIKQVARAYFDTDKIDVIETPSKYEFTISIDWNNCSNWGDLEQSIEEIKPAHLNFKFALNKSENININTDFKTYEFSCNMCGTFNSGTIPTFSNKGITLNENLNINSKNENWIQKYKMCGGKSIDN